MLAALVPTMAALRQSNLYDADRHTLFVYPALAVIAAFGFQRLCLWQCPTLCRRASLALVAALSVVLVLDNLALNPYQSSYLNEWGRINHNHMTTALDYWAISAKESLRQAQLNEKLPLNPVVDDSLSPLPLFIAFRQLAGHVDVTSDIVLHYQVRDVTSFLDKDGCSLASQVSRRLATGHLLVLSRLVSCPNTSPNLPSP